MAETFTSRIEDWRENVGRRLRRKWWYVLVIGPIGYVLWAVVMDGVVAAIKEYAKGYSRDHATVINQLSAIHATTILRPLIGAFLLCALFFMVLVAHAYWETRPSRKKESFPAKIKVTTYELQRTIRSHGPAHFSPSKGGTRRAYACNGDEISNGPLP